VDVEVEEKDVVCKTHDGELIRYYCEQCATCICVVCAFESPHRGHDVLTFAEALSRHGHSLDSLVANCQSKINCLRQQLERIRLFEAEINRAEEQVK
jgi:B-box zinc finger